jgi:DNA invertase Pin-like site-specific DNA recombinase
VNKNDHEPSAKEQEAAIRAWAKRAGHKVAAVYADEDVSGTNGVKDREALGQALADLRDGKADGLAAAHMDRLSRKLTVQEAILGKAWKAGARVFTADAGEVLADDEEDPVRTAIRQMLGVFAQLEQGMIRARLVRGKRAKRERGGYTGGWVPLGMRAEDRELVPDPQEQAAVALILAQHDQGASLREIIAALEEGGHRTKRGGRWHPSTVSRTLARHGKIPADQAIPRSKPESNSPALPMPAPAPARVRPPASSTARRAPQPGPACAGNPDPAAHRWNEHGSCRDCRVLGHELLED